jgi:protein TonB
MTLRSPLSQSLLIHSLFVLAVLLLQFRPQFDLKKQVEIEVLQYPKVAPAPTVEIKQPQVKTEPLPPQKAVFGVSRKAITATQANENTAEIKLGNTVAKEQDNLTLEKDDVDSLPIPADDFLVSQMPKLKSEVRIAYPAEAKKAGIEGPVVMDLIIDEQGKVRKVDLIRGPGFGLNEAAVEAIRQFEFQPAKVGDQSVAVKIRYTYRFVLENR